ncbi:MAG: TetR family transcriptional regulator [Rhodospirillales bacterium]|nr:MAG: TetR family transcriptional regulator [Rhodospirillales bacterium]
MNARPTTVPRSRGEATRQRLIDEAERQFSESGFSGATLSGIAGACGLGNAGALHHFASKEKLYEAVLDRFADSFESELQAIVDRHDTPGARLRAALRHEAARMAAHPRRYRLLLREMLDNPDRVERARALPFTRYATGFCALIAEAQAAGAAVTGPPALLLAQFLGTLSYALVARPTFIRMDLAREVPREERGWIEAVARAAERALLVDGAAGIVAMPARSANEA